MNNEHIGRVEINGRRYYTVTSNGLEIGTWPSMTTILGNTKDNSGLDVWRNKIGHAEADRISNLSMNRGTILHRLIELYKPTLGTPVERLHVLKDIASTDTEINQFNLDANGDVWLNEGWLMFMKFFNHHELFFDRIVKVIAAEKFIWSWRGYAGTLDCVVEMTGNKILVLDFKNSRKPKKDMHIEDYYLQVSGYLFAFYERTGIVPTGAEIWISNETEDKPQIFTLTISDAKHYFKEFLKRLKRYNDENKIE